MENGNTLAELRLTYTNMTEADGPDQAIYYNPLQKQNMSSSEKLETLVYKQLEKGLSFTSEYVEQWIEIACPYTNKTD